MIGFCPDSDQETLAQGTQSGEMQLVVREEEKTDPPADAPRPPGRVVGYLLLSVFIVSAVGVGMLLTLFFTDPTPEAVRSYSFALVVWVILMCLFAWSLNDIYGGSR